VVHHPGPLPPAALAGPAVLFPRPPHTKAVRPRFDGGDGRKPTRRYGLWPQTVSCQVVSCQAGAFGVNL